MEPFASSSAACPECLEEAGVLVAVMILLCLLTPFALPLCDSWGRGLGMCAAPILVFQHSILLMLTTVTMLLASF